jgi:small-conductance mechanosensitive channel
VLFTISLLGNVTGWLSMADLVSKDLTNWTRSDPIVRVDLRVGVAYGSDTQRVIELLRQVAEENSRVLRDPEPLPLMIGFGESSLDFRLFCWTRDEHRFEVGSELHLAVDAALRDADIVIPFLQHDLHIKPEDFRDSQNSSDDQTSTSRTDIAHGRVRTIHH